MSQTLRDVDPGTFGVDLLSLLPVGRENPIRASVLSAELGISERFVRAVIEELVDGGALIGSICNGERSGYFLIETPEDLEAGCGHLVSRARSLFRRVSALRRSAVVKFGEEQARLFDLDAEGGSTR